MRNSFAFARKTGAFVKRDYLIESSYKVAFVLELLDSLFPVLIVFFIGKLVGSTTSSSMSSYGGAYFPFAVVGVAFSRYFASALGAFSGSIYRAQMAGCLEAMLSSRTQPQTIVVLSAVYNFLTKTIHIFLVFMIANLALGMDLSKMNVTSSMVTLALSVCAFSSFGIFSATFVLIFKKGDPLGWVLGALSTFVSGAYFPLDVLPSWLQKVSYLVPLTHSIEAMRLSMLEGYSLSQLRGELTVLLTLTVVLLPVSISAFSMAVEKARRDGSLMKY